MARVYLRCDTAPVAQLAPGEVVWASVINGCEDPSSRGKSRPVLLIEAHGSAWDTAGLTTSSHYRHGGPRTPIPHPEAVGLRRGGYLWGGKLTRIAGIDVQSHIGWADEALAQTVISLAGLSGPVADAILDAARIHHPQHAHRVITGGVAR